MFSILIIIGTGRILLNIDLFSEIHNNSTAEVRAVKRFLSILAMSLSLSLVPVQAEGSTVVLGGDTVAITVNYEGVYVSGMYDFEVNGETVSAAREGSVRVGDRIVESNGRTITSLEDLFSNLKPLQKTRSLIPVMVMRDGQKEAATMLVCYLEQEKVFKTGLYVKDKIKGIGTMTFYDPSTMKFGALGHEIAEEGQSQPADVSMGQIFKATVVSLHRSVNGAPGEKICRSESMVPLGTVSKNTIFGLYGNVSQMPAKPKVVEIGPRQEVHPGPAEIYTVLNGTEPQFFTIQITEVHSQDNPEVKGISFTVTDQRLISQAGGIVQGMSGSPILQDGKLIGAVTHMVTSQPTNGYGIYIEWMLNEANG